MLRPITRRCIDCNAPLKNRSKETKRCWSCHSAARNTNARGRDTGACVECGGRLSLKKNVTGRCYKCIRPEHCAPHGPQSSPAWNKGHSIFDGPEHRRVHINETRKKRRASNGADMGDRIRTLIRNSLRRASAQKHSKTAILLGCSTAAFKAHLESQFVDGMSWSNYGNGTGRWNIDHIIPLALFDLADEAQQRRAFHFMNCRPLWSVENFRRPKGIAAIYQEL